MGFVADFFAIVGFMAVCPWCAAERNDPAAPCPVCGKGGAARGAAAAPSRSGAPAPATFDVPDLVIPAPVASRPKISAPPAARPAAIAAPTSTFDDDAFASDGADLQLDLGGVAGPSAPRAEVVAPSAADGGGLDPFDDALADDGVKLDLADIPPPRTSSGTMAAPISHRNLGTSGPPSPLASGPLSGPPSGSLPLPADEVDPFEARALADFGDPPTAPWLAPLYAIRVTRRRGELRSALAERRAEVLREAARADDALVAFAERVRSLAEKNGWRGFANVAAEEEVLRGRDGGLAAEMDAHRAELARADATLADVEGALAHAKAEESLVSEHLAAAVAVRSRAEAKVKRIDIELRNAAAQPGADPGGVQSLLAARNAEREAHLGEVAAQAPQIAEIEARLAVARRGVAAAAARVTVVQVERREVEDRFRRRSGTRGQGVEESRSRVRAALLEAGRLAVADEGAFGADYAAARAEVRSAEDRRRKAERAVRIHEAALASADPKKVTLGFALIAGAATLLVVLLLFPFIYGAIVNG